MLALTSIHLGMTCFAFARPVRVPKQRSETRFAWFSHVRDLSITTPKLLISKKSCKNDSFAMPYRPAYEKFPQKSLQCEKKSSTVHEDAWNFHRHYQHFHKKAWQRCGPLHGLVKRSEGIRSVGGATPARCCRSANSPGTVWLVAESVQRAELLPQKWWCCCLWKLWASSITCTWFFFFANCTNLWQNFSDVTVYGIVSEQQHVAGGALPTLLTCPHRL